jgi:hypothetical protein
MRTPVLIGYQKNAMTLAVFLLFFICLFSVYAGAEEKRWDLYYTEPDGTEHYYDLQNITSTSKVIIEKQTSTRRRIRLPKKYTKLSMVKVREKVVFNNPEHQLKESRILREFDCSKNITRILMISETHKNGFKKIEGKIQPWESINSKPSYGALFEIVCKP